MWLNWRALLVPFVSYLRSAWELLFRVQALTIYFQDFYKYKRVNFNNSGKDNPIYNEVSLDEFGNNLGNFDDSVLHVHPTATIDGNDAQHYLTLAKKVVNPYAANTLSKTYLKRNNRFVSKQF